ncbi:hypothetical protein F5B20DRAFT_537974 [Whalleya microplaca]|nr:hypothetical protein F5B20DRAFT_537974 [Whalleya microplaca]
MVNLDMTPALTPRDSTTSQPVNSYNSLQWGIVITFTITYFFATAGLGLRFFQAIKLVKKLELDLIIVTTSYGVALVYFVTMVNLMNYGWGQHLWDVPLEDLIQFNQGLLPNTLTYLICPSVTKMAALSVLYRINPSKTYRHIVVGIAVSIFIYTLVLCIITGGPCNPLIAGTTVCLENVALSQAVLNIVSDFAVITVPIHTIYHLHLSLKQKISIGFLMSIGSAVVVCSIARLPYVVVLGHTTDVTYTEAILGVWSIIEVNLGIICACAMRLKPLAVKYFPQLGLFSSNSRSTAKSSSTPWGVKSNEGISKSQHSYQLHSYQKSSADPVLDSKEIHVYRSYDVDVKGKSGQDDGSTHKILD